MNTHAANHVAVCVSCVLWLSQAGYAHTGSGCELCETGSVLNWMLFALLITILVVTVVALIRRATTTHAAVDWKHLSLQQRRARLLVPTFKVTISYLQVLALMADFTVPWPRSTEVSRVWYSATVRNGVLFLVTPLRVVPCACTQTLWDVFGTSSSLPVRSHHHTAVQSQSPVASLSSPCPCCCTTPPTVAAQFGCCELYHCVGSLLALPCSCHLALGLHGGPCIHPLLPALVCRSLQPRHRHHLIVTGEPSQPHAGPDTRPTGYRYTTAAGASNRGWKACSEATQGQLEHVSHECVGGVVPHLPDRYRRDWRWGALVTLCADMGGGVWLAVCCHCGVLVCTHSDA